jgi:hypothetical protein
MRGIAVALGAEFGVQAAEQLLERSRELAAFRLAQLLFFAGEPGDLDDPPFTLVGQVAMEGVFAAFEDSKLAVERGQFRCHDTVDVVDFVQEAQAAIAGVWPLCVQIDQRCGHLGLAVGMDGAVPLVE